MGSERVADHGCDHDRGVGDGGEGSSARTSHGRPAASFRVDGRTYGEQRPEQGDQPAFPTQRPKWRTPTTQPSPPGSSAPTAEGSLHTPGLSGLLAVQHGGVVTAAVEGEWITKSRWPAAMPCAPASVLCRRSVLGAETAPYTQVPVLAVMRHRLLAGDRRWHLYDNRHRRGRCRRIPKLTDGCSDDGSNPRDDRRTDKRFFGSRSTTLGHARATVMRRLMLETGCRITRGRTFPCGLSRSLWPGPIERRTSVDVVVGGTP
jgi:hypothetical protein